MSLIIIDADAGEFVQFAGVCYRRVGTTTEPVTGETPGAVFTSCDDCLYPTPTPTITATPTPTPTLPPSLLIDAVNVAARSAFGLRKLRSAYAGSAVKIIRSSDNTQLDIGFSGNDFDYVAAQNFCGAGNGDVVTWYDQSGNGRDAACPSAARFRIVTSGACLAGPKAGTYTILANNGYATFAAAGYDVPSTLNCVVKTGAAKVDQYYISSRQYGPDNGTLYFRVYDSNVDHGKKGASNNAVAQKAVSVNTWYIISAFSDNVVGNAIQLSWNGGARTNSGTLQDSFTQRTWTPALCVRSDMTGSYRWNGNISEHVVWSDALTAGQESTANTNTNTYYGVY